jgi:hypothetical protein
MNKYIENNFMILDQIIEFTNEYLKKEKLEEKNSESKLDV